MAQQDLRGNRVFDIYPESAQGSDMSHGQNSCQWEGTFGRATGLYIKNVYIYIYIYINMQYVHT